MSESAAPSSPHRFARGRMLFVCVLLALAFGAILLRAYKLQVTQHEKLSSLAQEQYRHVIELAPKRGSILFRDGSPIATSVDVDSVFVNARVAPDDKQTAAAVAKALRLPVADVAAKLQSKQVFTWLKRRISSDEAKELAALDIPGIGMRKEPRRYYPNGAVAGTVIGFADIDAKGREGIELTLDSSLSGVRTTMSGLRDAHGRTVFSNGMPQKPQTTGATVELTLDRFIQFTAEQALIEGVREAKAKAGTAVVLDPQTGDVLAIANVPSIDPNRPSNFVALGARNRAVTDPYEPGSTFKTFTVAAALDQNLTRPEELIDSRNGTLKLGRKSFSDAHPHDILTVSECIQKSSNVCVGKIGRRLGKQQLDRYVRNFGFAAKTEVGLPGERAGILRPVAKWGEIGLVTIAFGQGMTTTPMQIVTAMAAIANGGVRVPPRIVKRLIRADDSIEIPERPPSNRVVGEKAARQMTKMLITVTEEGGTATAAAIPGFLVAGKTGTAQKVVGKKYGKGVYIASFVGFVPADAPRLAIIVVIDEPAPERHYGGEVAAPVFKKIGEESLRYLGVTHRRPMLATMAPSSVVEGVAAEGGEDERSDDELSASPNDAAGNDDAEIAEARSSETGSTEFEGSSARSGSAASLGLAVAGSGGMRAEDVTLNPGEVFIPDFTGMSLGQALVEARRAGLRLELSGSGVAIGQSPGSGPAPIGTRCRIAFRPPGENESVRRRADDRTKERVKVPTKTDESNRDRANHLTGGSEIGIARAAE